MSQACINGQELYFEDSGGGGSAIIFMHGFLMNHSLFEHQVEALAPQYRCIRWDARCFGKTSWDGKPFTLYDSVKDCFGLMDFLNLDAAILVGMSQGGYCALRAALTSPERVKALVLMSTQSTVDSEVSKAAFCHMRDLWKQVGPVAPLIEGLATAILGPREASGMESHWNHWLPQWKQIPREAIFHAMNNLLERDEITPDLKDIKCPSFVIHGTDDIAMPISLGEALSKNLPNCLGFVTSPGAHAVNMTHFEIINPPLKKFLDDL